MKLRIFSRSHGWPVTHRGSEAWFQASFHCSVLLPRKSWSQKAPFSGSNTSISPVPKFSFESNTVSPMLKADTTLSQRGELNSLLMLKTQFRYAQLPTQALKWDTYNHLFIVCSFYGALPSPLPPLPAIRNSHRGGSFVAAWASISISKHLAGFNQWGSKHAAPGATVVVVGELGSGRRSNNKQ